jgi:hypothetical protein
MIVVNTSVFGGSIQNMDIDIYTIKGNVSAPVVPTEFTTVPDMTQELAVKEGDIVRVTYTGTYQPVSGGTTEAVRARLIVYDHDGPEPWRGVIGTSQYKRVFQDGDEADVFTLHGSVMIEETDIVKAFAEHICDGANKIECQGVSRFIIIEHVKGENW